MKPMRFDRIGVVDTGNSSNARLAGVAMNGVDLKAPIPLLPKIPSIYTLLTMTLDPNNPGARSVR